MKADGECKDLIRAIFELMCDHLRAEKIRAVRVLSGAACEAWLLAEIRLAIDWAEPPLLPPGHWAKIECGKRDIVICDLAAARQPVMHVIEVKLVYPSYAPAKLAAKLDGLRHQLLDRGKEDEARETQRSGLVFAAWENSDPRKMYHADFSQFCESVGTAIDQAFSPIEFTVGTKHPQAIIGPTEIEAAGQRFEVGLAGAWLTASRQGADPSAVRRAGAEFGPAQLDEAKRRLASPGRRFSTQEVLDHLRSLESQ